MTIAFASDGYDYCIQYDWTGVFNIMMMMTGVPPATTPIYNPNSVYSASLNLKLNLI